jgi:hypothetical protein
MTPQHFYLTISNPRPDDPVGRAEEGWYAVEDGKVILTDAAGVPLPGEDKREIEGDALVTARRALRSRLSRWARADFGRRLVYPTGGVV